MPWPICCKAPESGFPGPLVAYWFAVKFGHGPGLIGPIMASGFLLAALTSVLTGRLAGRFGIVPVVVGMRVVGLGLLVALPLAPSLAAAGSLYVLRSLFNRGTNGARAALSMGLVRPERRGFAAALGSVSVSLPRAAGPLLAGLMFEARLLALPFLLSAGLQAAYLGLYAASFARHERTASAAAGAIQELAGGARGRALTTHAAMPHASGRGARAATGRGRARDEGQIFHHDPARTVLGGVTLSSTSGGNSPCARSFWLCLPPPSR